MRHYNTRTILRIITLTVVGLLLPFLIWNKAPITAEATAGEMDWVQITTLTPNHYDNYTDPVTFTAVIDYSLYSQDQGIIYLGFNTDRPDYYEVDEVETDHIVVNKGVGRVVLSKTVVPKNWNSGASFAFQYVNGNYNLIKDFKVYANISPYPHDIPWTPLAIDEHVVTDMQEVEHKAKLDYGEKNDRDLGTEVFDCWIEDLIEQTASTEYNPQFAHLLITLCNSVHNKVAMDNSFLSLGFTDYEVDLELDDMLLGYGFAHKKLDSGETLVLIVGRGTEDLEEWKSNIDIQTPDGFHEGFKEAATDLKAKLDAYLDNNYDNKIFVLTGHSRGAAAINILAAELADAGIPQDKIYAYTFACPDVGKLTSSQVASYPMIFNIGNVNDIVTWVPRFNSSSENGKQWDKFGKSYWYAKDWNDWTTIYAKADMPAYFFDMHPQLFYLQYLREELSLDHYKTRTDTDAAIKWAVRERQIAYYKSMLTSYNRVWGP
jgi:hypothetical protein